MNRLIPEAGILRMWCDLYTPKSEAPVEGHLGAAIALISAAIGYKAPLTFARNIEPCTVNIILEGESALGRKTTTANTARELARRAVDDTDDDAGLYVHPVGHTSDAGLLELVAPKDADQAKRWNDTMTPPGHLLVWDEFGSILGDPGQNRKGSDWLGRVRTTIMGLTNGWHGGSKTKSNPIHASRCSVSILATMTREELEQRVSTGLLHDGFLGRFALIRMTPTTLRLAIPPDFTDNELHQEDDIIQWLRRLAFRRDAWDNPFRLLTPDARRLREYWYGEHLDELQRNAGDADLNRARGSAFGRLQVLAMKIAVVHAVSRLDDPSTQPLRIDHHAIEYGQLIADLCLDEITALAAGSGPAADQYQEKVCAYLERNGNGPISKRDLLRHVKYRHLDAHQRWRIIEDMHPDPITIERVDGPGPPSLVVTLVSVTNLAPLSPRENGDSPTKVVPNGASSVPVSKSDFAQPSPLYASVTTDDGHTRIEENGAEQGHTQGLVTVTDSPEDDIPLIPGATT